MRPITRRQFITGGAALTAYAALRRVPRAEAAFPTTGIVDDTTRSNENPLSNGGYWGSVVNAQLLSNTIRAVNPLTEHSALSASTYNADCEAYMTADPGYGSLELHLRSTVPPVYTFYVAKLYAFLGAGLFTSGKFYHSVTGTLTEFYDTGANVSFVGVSQFGFSVVGNVLTAYVNGSIAFQTTDTSNTITSGGAIGFTASGGDPYITAVGGGSIVAGEPTIGRRRGRIL